MTTLTIRFIAGRYHATPWGHHANEAAVAWPPEPLRLLRALIATWHLRADQDNWSDATLSTLIDRLADVRPHFRLPRGIHSHSRSYMPVIEGAITRKTLVFDGFLRLPAEEPVVVSWPGCDLTEEERSLLGHLAERLFYLGRAESWCLAQTGIEEETTFNCVPLDAGTSARAEPVDVLAPMTSQEYEAWRSAYLESLSAGDVKGKKRRLIEATLPERLVDLLRLDTGDFHAAGWSQMPGTKRITYLRDRKWNAGFPRETRQPADPKAIRFALSGPPLPRIEDSVRIGELFRVALMGRAKKELGEDAIPSWLSGRNQNGPAEGHGHAFFLPEDSDGDGWIDHVLVTGSDGLLHAREIIRNLRRIYTRKGEEWRVLLEWEGNVCAGPSSLVAADRSATWQAVTPYLHPWFRKKNFGYEEQLRRECDERGFPEIIRVKHLPSIEIHGLERRPIHFHRFRTRGGVRQPDRTGAFFEIEFSQPIQGPVALGFGCHYGLGLFRPIGE